MTTLALRTATPEDAPLVAEIIRRSFAAQAELTGVNPEEHPSSVAFETAQIVLERMQDGEVAVLAHLDDQPVGSVRYKVDFDDSRKGHINRLAVLPVFRGQGHGQALMTSAENALRELGVRQIEIAIVADFDRLQAYYEHLGYTPTHKRPVHGLPFEVLFQLKHLSRPPA
jgi:predicted N-acetyltransferase YhbS